MNDDIKREKTPPGISNLVMVKAYSTIHAATGASVKTISVAVEYSIARDLGVSKKELSDFVGSSGEDPKMIDTILTRFAAEVLDIRREDVRKLQAELGLGLETLAKKPPTARKRRDRDGKPRPV